MPYSDKREETRFLLEELRKVDSKTDNQILKNLLDQIGHSFRVNHKEIFDKHFIALSKLVRNLDLHFTYSHPNHLNHLSEFLEKLEIVDIPVGHFVSIVHSGPQAGEKNHYYVFRVQKEAIARVLLSD